MKIEIFIRHCFYSPNSVIPNRQRPSWFDKKLIFENFKSQTDLAECNYTIIYDNHFGPRNQTFLKDETNVVEINSGTEASSFIFMLNYVREKNYDPDTIIYFVEDDYLHRPNWDVAMREAFELPVHYVSLYDHLDKYLHYPDLLSKIYCTSKCHWRTTPSTCNTYAVKYKQLMEDYHTNEIYSVYSNNGVSRDHEKFVDLGRQGKVLVTPMPGYATHCDHLQSPTIDWKQYI